MRKELLKVTILLVSLYSSYSRPKTFFPKRNENFSNLGFFNGIIGRNQATGALKQASSGDIIEQTRTQADTLKSTLRTITKMSEAAPILEKVFAERSDEACINNMEEAIEAIETSTKLFENAGTEIKLLVKTVEEFQKIKDVSKAVKQAAKIIRLVDVLIPKLSPPFSTCKSASNNVLLAPRGLGSLLVDLSSTDDLYYTPQVRQSLKSSAKILSKATSFLAKASHFNFDHFCSKDTEQNKEFITAIGNMMSDLAELYIDLGGDIAAEQIKKKENFAKKIVAKIDLFKELDLVTLDCATPGSTEQVAQTIEDFGVLIDDIGMDNLCSHLDLGSEECKL